MVDPHNGRAGLVHAADGEITPTARTSLLAWETTVAAGHFLKLLRTRVGVRPAFAKIRIASVEAGQTLRCPFGQIRREPGLAVLRARACSWNCVQVAFS